MSTRITTTAAALALAGTSLGYGIVQLDDTVVNVAVSSIRNDLGGSIGAAQWVVDAYTVTFAALILSAGSLADPVGAKRLLVGGFAVFTLASAACGLAPDLGWLIGVRAVQGIGAAALVPSSLSVLSHAYPDDAGRARAVGLWAAGASVGLSGGPLLGGALIAASGWRLIFPINLPLGLLGAALVMIYSRETPRSPHVAMDPPGQLLAMLTLGVLAPPQQSRAGHGDSPIPRYWPASSWLPSLRPGSCSSNAGAAARCCRWSCSGHPRSRRRPRSAWSSTSPSRG